MSRQNVAQTITIVRCSCGFFVQFDANVTEARRRKVLHAYFTVLLYVISMVVDPKWITKTGGTCH